VRSHRRKFLALGAAQEDSTPRQIDVVFWGKYGATSRVVRRWAQLCHIRRMARQTIEELIDDLDG